MKVTLNILFSTDSTVDLSPELINAYGLKVLPLYIEKGGKTYKDGTEITTQEIFDYVDAGNPLCGTAAVTVSDYEDFFAENLKSYDAIIHTTISSDFSSCYQNARIASSEVGNGRVYVVDSRNLSTGIAHVVIQGVLKAREGADAENCYRYMQEITEKVETSFVISTLRYLAKGGRCSSVAALGANLLKLRPVISVEKGKMEVGKKYRGAYSKCLLDYVRERLAGRDDIRRDRIFITHAYAKPEDVNAIRRVLEAEGFEEILDTYAGSTVSAHCGPECLGILFIRK